MNLSGSQDEYCEGRWFDARQVLSSVKESGPFRLMLRFASANNWVEALRAMLAMKVRKGAVLVQHHRDSPDASTVQRLRQNTRALVATPATPLQDQIKKIPAPPGGWLRSESERRIGPGTNSPRKAESGKEQRRIERAKKRRRRERKKKLKQMKRKLQRSQSVDSAILPPI